MGLPMRYPRFFIVLFVALGLAASPAGHTYAANADPFPDAPSQTEAPSSVSLHSPDAGDVARRDAVVEFVAGQVELDHAGAERLLDAVTDLVIAVAGAGERVGVLEDLEVDDLHDALLSIAESVDPQPDQVPLTAGPTAEPAIAAADELPPPDEDPVPDPIERWRPLVEQYFLPELIEEALSIIDCESNGDPDARNPRSSASGLFQFLGRTWSHSSEQAGFEGESPFSPEANVAAAAWLAEYSLGAGDSAWAHWSCRP